MIKDCPFCGGNPMLHQNYSAQYKSYFIFIKCTECGSQGKIFGSKEYININDDFCLSHPVIQNSIYAWNSRIEHDTFNLEELINLTESIGAKTRIRGNKMQFVYCPYCLGNRKDKNTFYIDVTSGRFECKRIRCNKSGNFNQLKKDMIELGKLRIDKE